MTGPIVRLKGLKERKKLSCFAYCIFAIFVIYLGTSTAIGFGLRTKTSVHENDKIVKCQQCVTIQNNKINYNYQVSMKRFTKQYREGAVSNMKSWVISQVDTVMTLIYLQ